MSALNPEIFEEIINLIEPFMRDDKNREPLVASVFVGTRQKLNVSYSGSSKDVARRIAHALLEHGEIAEGQQALSSFLSLLLDQVGIEKQRRIRELQLLINATLTVKKTEAPVHTPDLFISHSSHDNALVTKLHDKLSENGIDVWLDIEDIKPGDQWRENIEEALRGCKCGLFVMSTNSVNSEECQAEWNKLLALEKPLFVAQIDDIPRASIPARLAILQVVKLTGDFDAGIGKLCVAIRQAIKNKTDGGGKPVRTLTSKYRNQYLASMLERVAFLELSLIDPGQDKKIPLHVIYIPSPTDVAIGAKVIDYKIVDWWVGSSSDGSPTSIDIRFRKELEGKYDTRAMQDIIAETQRQIDGEEGIISFEERERPLILAPLWRDGEVEDYARLDVLDIASLTSKLVIIGEPGSGKSTFTRYLTLCMVGSQLAQQIEIPGIENLKHWPHGSLTPILVELKRFVEWVGFPKVGDPVTADHFWKYVNDVLLETNQGFAEELSDDLANGRALIVLDGLDEVPIPLDVDGAEKLRQQQLIELAGSISIRYRNCRVAFTSRPYAYERLRDGFKMYGYDSVELIPLRKKEMSDLVQRLYQAIGLSGSEVLDKTGALMKELRSVADFLKDRPLFLTLMASLYLQRKQQGLPRRTGLLLRESIELLLDRWTKSRLNTAHKGKYIDPKVLYQKLETIAYHAHASAFVGSYDSTDIDIGLILRELTDYRSSMFEILDYLVNQTGIFRTVSAKAFAFRYRTFQEFLAASFIDRIGDFDGILENIKKNHMMWRQPAFLLADLLHDDDNNDNSRLWHFLRRLVFDVPEHSTNSSHWYPVWLAGRIVTEHYLYAGQIEPYNQVVLDELRRRTIELLKEAENLSPRERAEAGRALGFIGDTRRGVGVNNQGVPEIDWCEIPSGQFEMGTSKDLLAKTVNYKWAQGFQGFDREGPAVPREVAGFYVSRYLITRRQFQAFFNASDGYREQRWWPRIGWKMHSEAVSGFERPVDQEHPDNLPQYHVSWFEAVAFCNWLSAKLGKNVRLPREVEWEWIAKGTDNRLFPWGDDFDPRLCNSAETGIDWASPVGCFVIPNSTWGANTPSDLCGNVWEWCSTICEKEGGPSFPYPYEPGDGREDPEKPNEYLRIVRGGSYTNVPLLLRNTFRGRDRPFYRRPRQGFRVVMSLEEHVGVEK